MTIPEKYQMYFKLPVKNGQTRLDFLDFRLDFQTGCEKILDFRLDFRLDEKNMVDCRLQTFGQSSEIDQTGRLDFFAKNQNRLTLEVPDHYCGFKN